MIRKVKDSFTSSLDELGKKKPKVGLSIFAGIFTIVGWPLIALFQFATDFEAFPFPLFVGMFSSLFLLLPGSYWVITRRECVCVHNYDEVEEEKVDLLSNDSSTAALPERSAQKETISWWGWARRFLHWGFFCGFLISFFVLCQVYISPSTIVAMCATNGNVCVLFFRSDLFILVLIVLGIIKASRRGKRLDWVVAIFMACGISLFTWNKGQKFILNFEDDIRLISTCFLGAVSFALFPVSLRRSTMYSGIFKTIMVLTLYSFLFCAIGTGIVEKGGPWRAIAEAHFFILWKIFIVCIIVILWLWAVVATAMYSETIVTALALQFGLFLGDFGIHKYVSVGLVWNPRLISGLPMLVLSFLWLVKRTITLHFPDTLAFLKGKLGYFEEDMWDEEDEEELSLLRRNDRGRVPLHTEPSIEDLLKGPPPPSALASPGGLSGNAMGNFDPNVDYSNALSSIASNTGAYAAAPPSLPSRSEQNRCNASPKKAVSYGSISGSSLGNYDPNSPPPLPPRVHVTPSDSSSFRVSTSQSLFSSISASSSNPSSSHGPSSAPKQPTRTSSVSLSGNPMGNYDPSADYSSSLSSSSSRKSVHSLVDLEDEDSEVSKGEKKGKKKIKNPFKKKK